MAVQGILHQALNISRSIPSLEIARSLYPAVAGAKRRECRQDLLEDTSGYRLIWSGCREIRHIERLDSLVRTLLIRLEPSRVAELNRRC